jgi:hypothetical protein
MPDQKKFVDYDPTPGPPDPETCYRNGFRGIRYMFDQRVARKGRLPTFYELCPEAEGASLDQDVILTWRAAQVLVDQNFYALPGENQQRGDCVVKACKLAAAIAYTIRAMFEGVPFPAYLAGEHIYGNRGYCMDGWWSTACILMMDGDPTGLLPRAVYREPNGNDVADLSQYNPNIENSWPGNCQTPGWLNRMGAAYPLRVAARVASKQEAMDALAVGFSLSRDGSDGYSSTRNEDGVSDPSGSWSHAINVGAVIRGGHYFDKYGEELWGHGHHWGRWNGGGKIFEMPDGSWFVKNRHFERWIQRDQVVVAGDPVAFDQDVLQGRREVVRELSKQ